MTNSTRQGSMLSPIFFAVYIDDLLSELRRLGVGCHIGGVFVGTAGFADDLILVAPCRSAMVQIRDGHEFVTNSFRDISWPQPQA